MSAGLRQARPESENADSTASAGSSAIDSPASLDRRPSLRVDAFLGEWLSPDYFDQIIPPPASDRMVASAKAELLRRDEIILSPTVREGARSLSGHFPGGWGSLSHPTSPQNDEREQSPPAPQYFQRQRASTVDMPQTPSLESDAPQALSLLDTNIMPITHAPYVPPTPSYAVSTSDPIPAGYVAHARDACVKIDYQWDSMRTPAWGTGGDFGEEWSTMQERVNVGFEKMLKWYQTPIDSQSPRPASIVNDTAQDNRPAQNVVIIITHGADCNALINDLAGRPHLLDIGTASLTLAVPQERLPQIERNSDSVGEALAQQNDRSIPRKYIMPLIASTDHLRAGSNPSQLSSLKSPSAPRPSLPPTIPIYRNRLGSRPAAINGAISTGPAPGMGWSFMQRPATSGSPSSASGLWGSISSPTEKDDEADDFVPNFRDRRPTAQESTPPEPIVDSGGWQKQLPQRTNSQRGLWGSAPSLEDRDTGSRRRWTLAEQKL